MNEGINALIEAAAELGFFFDVLKDDEGQETICVMLPNGEARPVTGIPEIAGALRDYEEKKAEAIAKLYGSDAPWKLLWSVPVEYRDTNLEDALRSAADLACLASLPEEAIRTPLTMAIKELFGGGEEDGEEEDEEEDCLSGCCLYCGDILASSMEKSRADAGSDPDCPEDDAIAEMLEKIAMLLKDKGAATRDAVVMILSGLNDSQPKAQSGKDLAFNSAKAAAETGKSFFDAVSNPENFAKALDGIQSLAGMLSEAAGKSAGKIRSDAKKK